MATFQDHLKSLRRKEITAGSEAIQTRDPWARSYAIDVKKLRKFSIAMVDLLYLLRDRTTGEAQKEIVAKIEMIEKGWIK